MAAVGAGAVSADCSSGTCDTSSSVPRDSRLRLQYLKTTKEIVASKATVDMRIARLAPSVAGHSTQAPSFRAIWAFLAVSILDLIVAPHLEHLLYVTAVVAVPKAHNQAELGHVVVTAR